jgi:AcrR family transcriptional regulator
VTPRAGGRPRDPELTGLVKTVTIELLAERRMDGLNGDAIARRAGVGKAAIYRRWRSLDDLLLDVVRDLGVPNVSFDDTSTVREDLIRLLSLATTGTLAEAEAAVLSTVGRKPELARAYAYGPYARLISAGAVVQLRAGRRGEPVPAIEPILAAWALLLLNLAVGQNRSDATVADAVDSIALPALLGGTTP